MLTAQTSIDGSVTLTTDTGTWDVIRNGVNIDSFTGASYKDRRPNVRWVQTDADSLSLFGTWVDRTEIIYTEPFTSERTYWGGSAKSTAEVGAYMEFTYTGRSVAIIGSLLGGASAQPYASSATISVDGGAAATIDCSIPDESTMGEVYNPGNPGGVREYLNMPLWGQTHDAAETHTVRITVSTLEATIGRLTLDGIWVETGEGAAQFGQSVTYKLVSGQTETNTVTVTPIQDPKEVFLAEAEDMLAYQLTFQDVGTQFRDGVFPEIVNNIGYTSAYPVCMCEYFADAYLFSEDQAYYDAMNRQWQFGQDMKDGNGKIIFNGTQTHPQYDIIQINGSLALWRKLGEQRFLDEALTGMTKFVTNWTLTPLDNSQAADFHAEFASVYAQLWALPEAGSWYQSAALASAIETNVGYALSKQRADGSIPNKALVTEQHGFPGTYHFYTVAHLRTVYRLYRSGGVPIIAGLEAALDTAWQWETQFINDTRMVAPSFYSPGYDPYGWGFFPGTVAYGVNRGLYVFAQGAYERMMSTLWSDAFYAANPIGEDRHLSDIDNYNMINRSRTWNRLLIADDMDEDIYLFPTVPFASIRGYAARVDGTGPKVGATGDRLVLVDATDPNADRIRCVRGGVAKRLRKI